MQGELEVIKEIQNGEGNSGDTTREISRMPFLMLGLDLPPPPLFKDVMEKNIIPQVIVQSIITSNLTLCLRLRFFLRFFLHA